MDEHTTSVQNICFGYIRDIAFVVIFFYRQDQGKIWTKLC
jgi:hypothetical protein